MHSMQAATVSAPEISVVVPLGHGVQAVAPIKLLYEPGKQSRHGSVLKLCANEPGLQPIARTSG